MFIIIFPLEFYVFSYYIYLQLTYLNANSLIFKKTLNIINNHYNYDTLLIPLHRMPYI